MSTRIQTAVALTVSVALHGALALIPVLKEHPARPGQRVASLSIELASPVKAAPLEPAAKPVHRRRATHARRRPHILSAADDHLITPPDSPAPTEPGFGAVPEDLAEGGDGPTVPQGDTLATAPPLQDKPRTIKLKPPSFLSTPAPPPAPTPPPAAKRNPRLKVEHKVPYPAEARDLGVEGTVQVRILVGADGRVHKARVISGPGFGLNQAARAALLRYLFHPALDEQGTAREMWITYKYTFVQD